MTATLQRNATPQRTATPAASHGIWAAVDALTQPTQVPIERDNGHTNWAEVPSLWQQAQTLLRRAVDRGHAGSPARERSPLDLDLLEITAQIHETVSNELQTRGLLRAQRTSSTEPRLRRLAAHVIGHEPGRLWWWEHLFASWSRLLARCLNVGEHQPAPVRLRNSPCPVCGTRQVTVDTDDGPRIVPALVIEFNRGLVRAAECGQCGTQWGRGLLEQLADLLAG
jgi:hypothetical protein